ncbi:hypothetical protein Droror1_Dr00002996 [Drosera rotundifolia]
MGWVAAAARGGNGGEGRAGRRGRRRLRRRSGRRREEVQGEGGEKKEKGERGRRRKEILSRDVASSSSLDSSTLNGPWSKEKCEVERLGVLERIKLEGVLNPCGMPSIELLSESQWRGSFIESADTCAARELRGEKRPLRVMIAGALAFGKGAQYQLITGVDCSDLFGADDGVWVGALGSRQEGVKVQNEFVGGVY